MDMKEFYAKRDKIHSIYNDVAKADLELHSKGLITWAELGQRLVAYHKQELKDLRQMRKELVSK